MFNQLIKSTRNGQATTYGYNSQRQRVWKQTGDDFIQYMYKGNSEKLLAEYTNGTLTKEYVYAFGKLIAINSLNNSMYYVQTDHLGPPQVATNDSKQIVWQAQNKAFDRAVVINQIGDLNIGFPGQYYDQESGLYYNINRDYDPTTGRYIQTDPIGIKGGLSTYAYVLGNPVLLVDQSGLNPCYSFDSLESNYQHKNEMLSNIDIAQPNLDMINDGGSCATKLSNAMNRAGHNTTSQAFSTPDIRTFGDSQGNRYIFSALDMANHLGVNDSANLISGASDIQGQEGFIYFRDISSDDGLQGHVDLYDGSSMVGNGNDWYGGDVYFQPITPCP